MSAARGLRWCARSPRWLLAALLWSALAICLAGSAASPAAADVISAVNGFQAEQLPAAQLDAQLAAMQAAGVTQVRADAPWVNIEPQPPIAGHHTYQWAQTDAWVSALAAHGLAWEPIIDYSVWWAKSCPGFCAPDSDDTYATYAQAVAARYGTGGTFWAENPQLPDKPATIFEIWNEQNVSMFWIEPAVYARLYAAARTAVHAVDPSASVIVGGLADDSQSFNANTDYPAWYVEDMFAADPALQGNVDGFGLHPYGDSAYAVEQWVADFRGVLARLGEGSVPIDITEVGWPTVDSARETWRASMMNRLGTDLSRSNCGIRTVAPYDWIDPGTQDDPASDFGLVGPNGTDTALQPAGASWFAGLQQGPALPQLTLCAAPAAPPAPPTAPATPTLPATPTSPPAATTTPVAPAVPVAAPPAPVPASAAASSARAAAPAAPPKKAVTTAAKGTAKVATKSAAHKRATKAKRAKKRAGRRRAAKPRRSPAPRRKRR